jgi:hypothetical protein
MKKRKVVPKTPRGKQQWEDWVKWRMEDAGRKAREIPEPARCPAPECAWPDWRDPQNKKEMALPPETLCPACQRAKRG